MYQRGNDRLCGARALIADPDYPKKAMYGRLDEIRPCLRCMSCLTGGYYNLPLYCSVNPQIGRDSDYKFAFLPAEKICKTKYQRRLFRSGQNEVQTIYPAA